MNVLEDRKTRNREKKLNKAAVLEGTGQEKQKPLFMTTEKLFLKLKRQTFQLSGR